MADWLSRVNLVAVQVRAARPNLGKLHLRNFETMRNNLQKYANVCKTVYVQTLKIC